VVNFPHNPTGATISQKDFSEIIDICRENNIYLFSDEMYRFLEYDPKNRLPSASDLYEKAISLFGLSKSFALPGLRIGWLSSRDKELMQKIGEFKDYTTICNNSPGEILAIIALRNKDRILKRNLDIISENLELLDRFFAKYQDMFMWNRPVAGPIAFPEFKGELPISEFCEKLVEKNSTMLLPASVYGVKGNFFRIGFARKNLNEGLKKLEDFILNL
jgi:aspartate/methionine/tyrosine aminotransferase